MAGQRIKRSVTDLPSNRLSAISQVVLDRQLGIPSLAAVRSERKSILSTASTRATSNDSLHAARLADDEKRDGDARLRAAGLSGPDDDSPSPPMMMPEIPDIQQLAIHDQEDSGMKLQRSPSVYAADDFCRLPTFCPGSETQQPPGSVLPPPLTQDVEELSLYQRSQTNHLVKNREPFDQSKASRTL
ncbi:unnamed protein product, partial [Polarella glacialis]